MKKFNQWYNEAIEDGVITPSLKSSDDEMGSDLDMVKPSHSKMVTGLSTAGKYASMAAKAGEKKTYNLKQIESLVDTFVSQFNKPSEQRMLVRILKKKLVHAKDMFKPDTFGI